LTDGCADDVKDDCTGSMLIDEIVDDEERNEPEEVDDATE
jgi:hypothetical protein